MGRAGSGCGVFIGVLGRDWGLFLVWFGRGSLADWLRPPGWEGWGVVVEAFSRGYQKPPYNGLW